MNIRDFVCFDSVYYQVNPAGRTDSCLLPFMRFLSMANQYRIRGTLDDGNVFRGTVPADSPFDAVAAVKKDVAESGKGTVTAIRATLVDGKSSLSFSSEPPAKRGPRTTTPATPGTAAKRVRRPAKK